MKVRCIDDSGMIRRSPITKGKVYPVIDKEECGTTMDDGRYKFGNYAKTKEELEFKKLEKIKQILQGD